VIPRLDVAKTRPVAVLSEGDNGFPFLHFGTQVFGGSFGDTRSAGFGTIAHFIANSFGVVEVTLVGSFYGVRSRSSAKNWFIHRRLMVVRRLETLYPVKYVVKIEMRLTCSFREVMT
jgi:hypothetical protein